MGPNGPALVSSLSDFWLLPKDLKEAILTLGGPLLEEIFTRLESWPDYLKDQIADLFPKAMTHRLRKLSVKPDREGKSRLFAILDYWSQTSMVRLHKNLFKILKKLPRDCTFNQGSGLDLGPPSTSYHSFDLTNATDRFPVKLQQILLSHLIGKKKSLAWEHIMTHYEFDLKGKPVKYMTGQPMGAYSSWASFTLCHHLIVQFASMKATKAFTEAYSLLGDDIVIAHDDIAAEYKAILRQLDVSISETKSHVSVDTYEFAKRWKYRGSEVSPFPVFGLIENVHRYHLLYGFFCEIEPRGFSPTISLGQTQSLVPLFYILGKGSRLIDLLQKKIKLLAIIPKKGESVDSISIKARAFADAIEESLSCNLSNLSVSKIFETYGAGVITRMMAKEAEKLSMESMKWKISISEMNSVISPEPADQAERMKLIKDCLPVVEALAVKAEASMVEAQAFYMRDPSVMIDPWQKCRELIITPIPKMDGIIPTRASHRILGAFATFAINLAIGWKSDRLGIRVTR